MNGASNQEKDMLTVWEITNSSRQRMLPYNSECKYSKQVRMEGGS